MSFTAGGSGSISSSTDVFLSNVADNELLTYDQGVAKWRNKVSPGVPAGGTSDQVLAKRSSVDQDTEWISTGVLSNDLPLQNGNANAGTEPTAARADHVHPVQAGVGYPLAVSGYSNPLGNIANDNVTVDAGHIRVSPLPVYRNYSLGSVMFTLRANAGAKNMQLALYASDQLEWKPTTLVSGVIAVSSADNTLAGQPTFGTPVSLQPGLYWVALLAIGTPVTLAQVDDKPRVNTFHAHNGYNSGYSSYVYDSTTYTELPVSLAGQTFFLDGTSTFQYGIRPAAV